MVGRASGRGGESGAVLPSPAASTSTATAATSAMASPSRRAITRTPCVLRLYVAIPATGIRIIRPVSVAIISSSASETHIRATSGPVLGVVFMASTPRPPRVW